MEKVFENSFLLSFVFVPAYEHVTYLLNIIRKGGILSYFYSDFEIFLLKLILFTIRYIGKIIGGFKP